MTTTDHETAARGRAAITQTLGRMIAAWNAGDAAAYGAQFTEDASYVTFAGDVLNGRAEIERIHHWLFEGPLRGSRLAGGDAAEVAAPRFISPGVAVVQQGGGVRPEGAAELAADRASVATFVLVEQQPDDWRIAAFHNTRRQSAEREQGGQDR